MKKFFYRVQPNDTVTSIANAFGVPVTFLISKNNLVAEVTHGDLLIVEIPDRKTYTVGAYDTLLSVAEKFNTTPQKILLDNGVPYIFYGLTVFV